MKTLWRSYVPWAVALSSALPDGVYLLISFLSSHYAFASRTLVHPLPFCKNGLNKFARTLQWPSLSHFPVSPYQTSFWNLMFWTSYFFMKFFTPSISLKLFILVLGSFSISISTHTLCLYSNLFLDSLCNFLISKARIIIPTSLAYY